MCFQRERSRPAGVGSVRAGGTVSVTFTVMFCLLMGADSSAYHAGALIPDATYPAACGLCHGSEQSPAPDGTEYPDTAGAHSPHDQRGFDCFFCHNTPEGPGGDGHYDFVAPADVILAATHPLVGAAAIYDATSKSCSNVYCHDPQGESYAATAPRWLDPTSVSCGSCHAVLYRAAVDLNGDGRVGSRDLALFGLDWNIPADGNPATPDFDRSGTVDAEDLYHLIRVWHTDAPIPTFPGSHGAHFDSVRGPGITECTTCHPDNTAGHSPIDGTVMFKDGLDLSGTTACNHCHGVTADTKPTWGGSVACADCHETASPANSRPDGTGVSAPARPFFASAGHGLASSATFPVTGNPGPGFGNCQPCHDPLPTTGRHISHVLGDYDRLRPITGDSHDFTTRTTEYCLDCHLPEKTTPGELGVDATAEANIHSSAVTGNYGTLADAPIAFPAYGDDGGFAAHPGYQCRDCHDPHGTSNSAMVLTEIDGKLGGESNPVLVRLTEADPEWARGSDGVCEACHTAGGEPHPDTKNPGNHNLNQDCRKCHDTHPASFQPNATSSSCTDCHNTAQGARRPVLDDFGLRSHHLIGAATDSQCEVCHDTSQHMGGTVVLKDPDNPGASITYTSGGSLESFCLGCHDANGAAGDTDPFNDGGSPVDIGASWSASAHKASGKTCMGDGTGGCHDNGHGSRKKKLLAPAGVAATGPALAEEEEGFCYQCHTAIEGEFGLASRHDVAYADQNAHGSRVECVNCHNPHVSTITQPLIDPDAPSVLAADAVADFCLRCHDGAPPAGVTFPSQSPGSGYNKSRWVGSKHQLTGLVTCGSCHAPHGSTQAALKTLQYDQADFVTYSHGSDQYALCWQCHDEDKVVRTATGVSANNAFGTRHSLHVRTESAACIICHDVHAAYDDGEDGLMSFAYPVKKGWDFSLGANTLSSAFADTGTNKGTCRLTCHGMGHSPESYTGVDANTLK